MQPQPRCAKAVPAGPCAKECCNAKSTSENKYCKKHQLCVFIDDTEALGKRVCKNVIRGCTSQLEQEYEFVRCEPCRQRELERDNARKAKKLAENVDEGTRLCNSCDKVQPLDEFVGTKNKGFVKSCKTCRETWKRNDAKRDKEHRNALAREASKNPERIAVKKAWEAANPDKVEQKTKKYRAKRAAKDIDGYLQHNANVMKNWRDRNPEKMAEVNRKRRESIEEHFKIYQRSARLKKLPFTFSEEEFKELVVQPCYYCDDFGTRNESRNRSILPKNDEGGLKEECDIVDEKGFDCVSEAKVAFHVNVEELKSLPSDSVAEDKVFTAFNGIDRMNQAEGYIQSNSVSCCEMCNWLKGSLDSATFIKRMQHIHSFAKNSDTTRHPECFPDAKCVSYASYRSRALKKELEFALSKDDYKTITEQDCYLCGKKTTETNTNGIDRVDNTVGYTVANCKACCKECNHMKNNYGLDDLFSKIEKISNVWANRTLPILPVQIHSIVAIAEKMTKAELEQARKQKKDRALQKHREYLASIEVNVQPPNGGEHRITRMER